MSHIMPQARHPLRPPLRTQDLSPQQRSLVDLMREHQFGRIENISVRAGQPVLDCDMRVVRFVRLGGDRCVAKVPKGNEFELKRSIGNLFDELARLGNGTVITLEFKHGLPFLIEIVATIDELNVPTLIAKDSG
jgi:hypothetical protein